MLFRVEARTERDDVEGLATITQARDEAFKAIGEGNAEQIDAAIKRTIFLVRTSSDLTKADRKRVADALKADLMRPRASNQSV
jgi:thiamine monophosphate synthase